MHKSGKIVQLAAALLAAGLAILSNPLHALPFEWREAALPVEDMQLTRVAAGPEYLLAIGGIGTLQDFQPLVATSADGLDWRIVDIGLAGRRATDVIHTGDGFIVALDDGSLRIGGLDRGWTEITPPAEARLTFSSLVEHQGRLLLFGFSEENSRASRVIAGANFQSWEILYERTQVLGAPGFADPVSSGWGLAMHILFGPPSIPFDNLFFSTDGSNWAPFDDGGAGYSVRALSARDSILYASVSGSPGTLQIFRRGPDDADWQRFPHPEFQVESSGPMQGGTPGLILGATIDGQRALLASIDGDSWARQGFAPSGAISDFVAWRGGWVGVGESALRGQPQGTTPVPTISTLGLVMLALMLGLFARARFSPRQRAG